MDRNCSRKPPEHTTYDLRIKQIPEDHAPKSPRIFFRFIWPFTAMIIGTCVVQGYTLKQIYNWPLYKIWYYATYLIDASKVWLLCIVHTNLLINGRKKHFHVQNCPCGTVGAKIGCVRGLLVHGKVVVEFSKKVFLVLYNIYVCSLKSVWDCDDRDNSFFPVKLPSGVQNS